MLGAILGLAVMAVPETGGTSIVLGIVVTIGGAIASNSAYSDHYQAGSIYLNQTVTHDTHSWTNQMTVRPDGTFDIKTIA